MKVLYRWLLEMCDLPTLPTPDEVARALTRGGLEVEAQTDLGAGFSGVVVAEVVAKRPHPQADKLTLVDVITERGGAATQVVCGAPNVPDPGRRVLWAQVGAQLPGMGTLAPKTIKGISSPGMLCAEDELGLGDDHAGIIVLAADDHTALGAPAQQALFLDDTMFELNSPANRGDVLGHLGVARDLCAMLRGRLVPPDVTVEASGSFALAIHIADPAISARYTARLIEGVRVAPSPRRMAARLRGVGVRPISNLVDITNYVLFELGQPLHAFDADTLTGGKIAVARAADGEQFTTLDTTPRTLVPGDLVIKDGDRSVALAGVMGGLASEVTDKTTRVLLEAASFDAKMIRKTARRLNLRSEASLRFERGVDPELAALASARAARLFVEHAGGRVVGGLADAYPGKRVSTPIAVRMPRVRAMTGVALDAASCRDAVERLGCTVTGSGETFEVTPPSARPDIAREADVIEEILRVVGFEHVPSTLPVMRQAPPLAPMAKADRARLALAAAGLDEAITFAFQSVERCASLHLPATDHRAMPISLRNPMSIDQAVMRTALVPNLLAAVARNQSYGRRDVALFECGSVFLRRGESVADRPPPNLAGIDEPAHAAGVCAGKRPAQIGEGAAYDVFDIKAAALVAIRGVAGEDVVVTERAVTDVTWLHPGVAGELSVAGDVIGWFGEVHPRTRKVLGVDGAVFAFELDLERLAVSPPRKMVAIPKFPSSTRDVSLLLDAGIPAGRVRAAIGDAKQPLVKTVRLLEDYRGDKVSAGMKSMLWTIAYQAGDRTLTDVEVDAAHEAIVGRLVENLPAQRR